MFLLRGTKVGGGGDVTDIAVNKTKKKHSTQYYSPLVEGVLLNKLLFIQFDANYCQC